MKPLLAAVLSTALLVPAALPADPAKDARAIAAATVTPEILAGTFEVFRPMIANAIVGELSTMGIEVNDPQTLVDIIVEQFGENFLQGLRDAQVEYFLASFSDEDLAAVADFYASSAGQRLINATPDLMAVGAAAGERLGQQAYADARQTIAARIEEEGVLIEAPSTLERLIDILRQ